MSRLSFVAVLCAIAAAQPAQPDPISVGIVVDSSGSIGAKMRYSRQVIDQFLKTAQPQDEFFLVKASDHPAVVTGFTSDADQLLSRLSFMKSAGRSALLDAIQTAIAELKQANNTHKIVLVISDGGDNASSLGKGDVEELAQRSDVRIFAIGVHEAPEVRRRSPEEAAGQQLLTDIAEHTGGKYFAIAPGLERLSDVGAAAGEAMRK